MNWSAADVADVPPGVVTVTSTVPVPAGEVAVIEVAELTVTPVAGGRAELHGGRAGEVGAGDRHRCSAGDRTARRRDRCHRRRAEIAELVRRRSRRRAARGRHLDVDYAGAGRDVAVIEVAELTVKLVAVVPPNVTAVAPVKSVPVIVTTVPPAVGPVSARSR